MKYIMFRDNTTGMQGPIIFPDHIPHAFMVQVVEGLMMAAKSGGKISFPLEAIDNVFVHGSSPSTGLKPDNESDERVIQMYLKQQTIGE